MRVEAAPPVYALRDRRVRNEDRRGQDERRRGDRRKARARHDACPWFQPAFGAHILGQMMPAPVDVAQARAAYAATGYKRPNMGASRRA